ncbi:hypothetical protein A5881_000489 [Enterococcus termitis]
MNIKYWIKFMFGVMFFSLIFALLIMLIPELAIISGTPDGWLGYWGGIIGSSLGVFGAYLVMKNQLDFEKKETKKEKEANILMSNTSIKKGAMLIDSYFDKEKKEILRGIPLVNIGTTAISHIEYSFSIINFEDATSDYFSGGEETRITEGFNPYTSYSGLDSVLSVSPIKLRTGDGFILTLSDGNEHQSIRYDTSKSSGTIPVLMPGSISYITIPNEIVGLYIYHMVCFMVAPTVDYDDMDPSVGGYPQLKIDVTFLDYLNVQHKRSFEVYSKNWNFDDYSFDLQSKAI